MPAGGRPVGPDARRLWSAGDFNVEVFTSELAVGANAVLLRAQDGLGNQSERTVTVDYQPGTWPGSWTADWDAAAAIEVRKVESGKGI